MRYIFSLVLIVALCSGCYTSFSAVEDVERDPVGDKLSDPPRVDNPIESRDKSLVIKDPSLATILGFIVPGGGQFYAGRSEKGALVFIGTAAALRIGFYRAKSTAKESCTSIGTGIIVNGEVIQEGQRICHKDGLNMTAFYRGAAIGTAIWLYGLFTAGDDARRWNDARQGLSLTVLDEPGTGKSRLGVGYSVRF